MSFVFKNIICFLVLFCLHFQMFGQAANCNNFCVTNIQMDTANPNILFVTIYNGDSFHINYPYLDYILDSNNDTIANSDLSGGFFAHLGMNSQTYMIATTLDSVPNGFIATVALNYYNFTGSGSDTMCILPYPCAMTNVNKIEITDLKTIVYPNPTTQYATITIDRKTFGKYSLRLYNAQGILVLVLPNMVENTVELDLKNLPKGLYVFDLQSEDGARSTGTLIKN